MGWENLYVSYMKNGSFVEYIFFVVVIIISKEIRSNKGKLSICINTWHRYLFKANGTVFFFFLLFLSFSFCSALVYFFSEFCIQKYLCKRNEIRLNDKHWKWIQWCAVADLMMVCVCVCFIYVHVYSDLVQIPDCGYLHMFCDQTGSMWNRVRRRRERWTINNEN